MTTPRHLETYLAYTGQIDDEGRKFSTNTESEGRYHSKWLRMMYPRLYLARNLLAEEGVIFISIDDNELTNLRHLLDEMFGEECFVGQVTVLCNPQGAITGQISCNLPRVSSCLLKGCPTKGYLFGAEVRC